MAKNGSTESREIQVSDFALAGTKYRQQKLEVEQTRRGTADSPHNDFILQHSHNRLPNKPAEQPMILQQQGSWALKGHLKTFTQIKKHRYQKKCDKSEPNQRIIGRIGTG